MIRHLLQKTLLLCAIMLTGVSVSAKDYTYDFSNSIPNGWSASATPNGFETSGYERGCQFLTNATLTLTGVKNVSKVVITCSANTDKNGVAVSVGGKEWGSETLPKQNNMTKTYTGAAASGNVVLTITRFEKSVYIKQIVITADESDEGGNNGDTTGGDTGSQLDDSYVYAEPTIVGVSGATGSNSPYTFIQNNIEVKCSTGAQNDTYFGCNAGNDITFTATKPIKAIVVDGFVKQNFEATTNFGNIGYVDASEAEVTANPVLAVTDIDSKTITLSCVKQMRCYKVYFYFETNPDVEFDMDGGDGDDDFGDFNFDYEPETATTLNITFDEVYEQDFTEDAGYALTDLYFVSEDYEMEMYVFAPKDAQCGVAPGLYPINETYEDGTVQASPGGDDFYDYPSYIATDFEYDEEWGWYYNAAYYLVSGTLKVEKSGAGVKYTIDAKSYKGSTIKATFTGLVQSLDEEDSIESVDEHSKSIPTKQVKDGQILITRNGRTYTVDGVRVK